jgi:hypothetical protein
VERKLEAVAGLAPAHGLSLVEVIYQPEILEVTLESSENRRR